MRSCFLLAPLALAACFQANSTTPVQGDTVGCTQNCAHHGSGGAGGTSSGASSSAAGATTGGGSSTGGATTSATSSGSSSGGSTSAAALAGEYVCPQAAVPPLTTTCPDGFPLPCQIVDLIYCTPVVGATINAIGADGVTIAGASTHTDSNGAFVFCLPFETAFTVQATAQGYVSTNLAEILLPLDGGAAPNLGQVGQIGLLQTEFVDALSLFVPGGYDQSEGLVVAAVGGTGACVTADAGIGWTLSIALADGGAFPDGGYTQLYLSPNEVASSSTTTTAAGVGLFVNVDIPTDDYIYVYAAKADQGICPLLNPEVGFTGRLLLGANTGSFAPFILP